MTARRLSAYAVGVSAFGDADPEDAYDDGDSLAEKLIVLGHVLVAVASEPDKARFLLRLAWARHKLDELSGG